MFIIKIPTIRKAYFQMYGEMIWVGYSIDGQKSKYITKLNEDTEHVINNDDVFPYNQSVKKHTITFEEVDNEYHLSGNVQNNRSIFGRYGSLSKKIDINLDTVDFDQSKNEYVFWVSNPKFKKTLLRDSYNYIKMYLPQ